MKIHRLEVRHLRRRAHARGIARSQTLDRRRHELRFSSQHARDAPRHNRKRVVTIFLRLARRRVRSRPQNLLRFLRHPLRVVERLQRRVRPRSRVRPAPRAFRRPAVPHHQLALHQKRRPRRPLRRHPRRQRLRGFDQRELPVVVPDSHRARDVRALARRLERARRRQPRVVDVVSDPHRPLARVRPRDRRHARRIARPHVSARDARDRRAHRVAIRVERRALSRKVHLDAHAIRVVVVVARRARVRGAVEDVVGVELEAHARRRARGRARGDVTRHSSPRKASCSRRRFPRANRRARARRSAFAARGAAITDIATAGRRRFAEARETRSRTRRGRFATCA